MDGFRFVWLRMIAGLLGALIVAPANALDWAPGAGPVRISIEAAAGGRDAVLRLPYVAEASLPAAIQPVAEVVQPPNPALPTFRSADSLGVEIAPPAGRVPEANARVVSGSTVLGQRAWPRSDYRWSAANSRHHPLYFEEVNAERYGYTPCAPLQPAISAAHFFVTVPALPYLMANRCPRECVYTLGHYRPGDCNPWRWHKLPCSVRGATAETAAVWGLILFIP